MISYRPLALISVLSLGLSFGLTACGKKAPAPSSGAGSEAATEPGSATHAQSRDQVPSSRPNFLPAEGWVAYPPENAMRQANYRVPGADGEGEGVVAVAPWGGKLGGLEANVKRWMDQAGIEGDSVDLTEDQRWDMEVRDFVVTVLHLDAAADSSGADSPGADPSGAAATGAGTDDHGATGAPLLVAYIEKPGDPGCWTVKLTGSSATINKTKPDFIAFLEGL